MEVFNLNISGYIIVEVDGRFGIFYFFFGGNDNYIVCSMRIIDSSCRSIF